MERNNYFMKGNDEDPHLETKVEFKEWLKTNHFKSDSTIETKVRKLEFMSNMFTRHLSGHKSVFEIDNCESLESFTKKVLNHHVFLNLNKNEKEAYEACLRFYKEFLSKRATTNVDQSNFQAISIEKLLPKNGLKDKIDEFDLCHRIKKTNEEKFIDWLYFNKSISIEKAEHVLKRINQIEFVFSENLDNFDSVTEIKSLYDYQSVKVNLLEDPHFRELDKKNLNVYKNSLSLFEEYLKKPKINYGSGQNIQTATDSRKKDREVSVIKAEKKAEPQFKHTEKQRLAFDNQELSKNTLANEEKKVDSSLTVKESQPNDATNYERVAKTPDTFISELFKGVKYRRFLDSLQKDGISTIEELLNIDIFKYLNVNDLYLYKQRIDIFVDIKKVLKKYQKEITKEKEYQAPKIIHEVIMPQIPAVQESLMTVIDHNAVSDLNDQLVSLDDVNSYIGKKPHYFILNGIRYQVNKWDDVLFTLCEQLFIMKPEEMAKWIDKPCFENSELILFSKKPINYEKERKLSNGIFIVKFSRINIIIKTCYSLCDKCGIQPQAFSVFSTVLKNMQPFNSEAVKTSHTKQSVNAIPPKEIETDTKKEVQNSVSVDNQTVYRLSDLPKDLTQLRPCILNYANASIKISSWHDCYHLFCQLLVKMKIKSFKMARFNNQIIINQKKCLSYSASNLIKPKNIGMSIWIETDYTEVEAIWACELLCAICLINKNDVLITCINNENNEKNELDPPIGLGYPLKEINAAANNDTVAETNQLEKIPPSAIDVIQPLNSAGLENENQTVEFEDVILGVTGKDELQESDLDKHHEFIILLSNLDEKHLSFAPKELDIEKQTMAVKNWVDLYLNLIKHLTTTHIEVLKLLRYKNIILPNHKKIISYTSIHLKDPQYIGKNMFVELALDNCDASLACQVLCEKCKIDMSKIAIKLTKTIDTVHRDDEKNESLINDYEEAAAAAAVANVEAVVEKATLVEPVIASALQSTLRNPRQSQQQQYIQRKTEQLNEFLLSTGFQATHLKELREKSDLYSDDLFQIINHNPQFVEILDKQYIHRDNIIDLDVAVDDMEKILTTHFNQFLGYSNNQLLYKALRINNMLFLNDNDLDDMEKVYFLAKHIFGREKKLGEACFFFGNKHICEKTPDFPKSTIGLLINYGRSKDNLITREECQTYLEKICLTCTSIRQILQIGYKDIFLQYDTDQYLLKESLKIDGEWLQQLNECLAALLAETDFAIIRDINKEWYQKLPRLPYGLQWTPLFLQEVLHCQKVIKYQTIPAIKGQHYDTLHAAIIAENSGVETFGDVVYSLLFAEKMVDKRYEGEELRQCLKNYGLIEKNELYASMPQALVDYRFAWDSDKKTVFINGGA